MMQRCKNHSQELINEHDGNQEENCVFGEALRIITVPNKDKLKNERIVKVPSKIMGQQSSNRPNFLPRIDLNHILRTR